MDAKHTPWTVEEGGSTYRFQVKDASGKVVARVVGGLTNGGSDRAKLIAAAPALADALFAVAAAAVVPHELAAQVEAALRAAGRIP